MSGAFLCNMDNNEIEKKNGDRKWDICLMNPPYGSVGGDTLHLKFVNKVLEIAKQQVTIMPFSVATRSSKPVDKYKDKLSKYLISVDEVDSKVFEKIWMMSVGIYYFNDVNDDNEDIKINFINGQTTKVNNLKNFSSFNEYEKNIVKYLFNEDQENMYCGGCATRRTKELSKIPTEKHEEFLVRKIIDSSKKIPKDKSAYLALPNAAFSFNFITGRYGKIFDSYQKMMNYFIKNKTSSGFNILTFDSIKEAENCKIALQNPILRFTLYKTKDDQNMHIHKCYRYIPAIDWSDDMVKTDEGLLEVCGCPKDKCKEYADYCKKIIEEVDANK